MSETAIDLVGQSMSASPSVRAQMMRELQAQSMREYGARFRRVRVTGCTRWRWLWRRVTTELRTTGRLGVVTRAALWVARNTRG